MDKNYDEIIKATKLIEKYKKEKEHINTRLFEITCCISSLEYLLDKFKQPENDSLEGVDE